jgi:hypothetical protein
MPSNKVLRDWKVGERKERATIQAKRVHFPLGLELKFM